MGSEKFEMTSVVCVFGLGVDLEVLRRPGEIEDESLIHPRLFDLAVTVLASDKIFEAELGVVASKGNEAVLGAHNDGNLDAGSGFAVGDVSILESAPHKVGDFANVLIEFAETDFCFGVG
jgi:hypothetical protein